MNLITLLDKLRDVYDPDTEEAIAALLKAYKRAKRKDSEAGRKLSPAERAEIKPLAVAAVRSLFVHE